jgi:crossover junction endodeoxyribonuclease RusA
MAKIILLGNPLSTQHIYKITYRSGFPRMYMTSVGYSLKEIYQLEAKTQWNQKIIDYNIELYIKLYFKDKRKRDIDNHSKIILDSLTGIVYLDDKYIKKMTIEMLYDKRNPRAEIEISKYKEPA